MKTKKSGFITCAFCGEKVKAFSNGFACVNLNCVENKINWAEWEQN